jgi:hypothetical protein
LNGYIKLARCLIEKPIFNNEKLLKVWIWCLFKASHKEHEISVGLQKVNLLPGQFVTGRKAGADELGLNESTFWKYLCWLNDNESIDIKSNNKFSLVTVVNWASYQIEQPKDDSKSNNKVTTKRQQNDTNNNGNKGKNEKKYIYTSSQMLLAEKLKGLILTNNPGAKVPDVLNGWANEVRLMVDGDNRAETEIAQVIEWSQKSDFWKANILSVKKLREKYDTLLLQMKRDKPKDLSPLEQAKQRFLQGRGAN